MRYYRYLYLSEGLEKKKDRIIAKLEKEVSDGYLSDHTVI